MLLQENIKDFLFSVLKPQVWVRPRFEHVIKKIKNENEFFQQKDCDIQNQRPFLSIKWKFSKSGKSTHILKT